MLGVSDVVLTAEDQEEWFQQQCEFFRQVSEHTPAKRHRRGSAADLGMEHELRRPTCNVIRAMGNAMRHTTTRGLSAFAGGPCLDNMAMIGNPPTLILHFDEGSPNLAMLNYLQYAKPNPLRIAGIRDVCHCEWSDLALAIKRSRGWHGCRTWCTLVRRPVKA